jgi:hypothetical protein
MPAISFSNDDIKAGYLIQNPGRYKYELTKIKVKPAKTDGSPNYVFQFKGLDGEMEGVVVFVMLSSKASWLIAPIVKACNGGVLEAGVEYNVEDLAGCQVTAMTTRGTRDDGGMFNSLNDFKPVE